MKILVLQLGRLGDIFQTWPTLRALREQFPDAQIDLLTRRRFSEATCDLEAINFVWLMDGQALLTPVLSDDCNIDESLAQIDQLIESVVAQQYQRVINLSFSPLSSYLAEAIARAHYTGPDSPMVELSGYGRTEDGYLSIGDDTSAYLYAQVGVARKNRVHLCDIFAAVADVELSPHHWSTRLNPLDFAQLGEYIVIQVGASQANKTYDVSKWTAVVSKIAREWPGQIILVGSLGELALAEQIMTLAGSPRLLNFVGRSTVCELMALIAGCRLVIGADSVAMHVGSLVNVPCLNLSFASVNFWETGPRAPGSRILYADEPEGLPSDRVVNEALSILTGAQPSEDAYVARASCVAYQSSVQCQTPEPFEWQLIEKIYWPMADTHKRLEIDGLRRNALTKMADLNSLAIAQLDNLNLLEPSRTILEILDRIDEAIAKIGELVVEISPLVRWYQTEKVRVGPMSRERILAATRTIHQRLDILLKNFMGITEVAESEAGESIHGSKGAT